MKIALKYGFYLVLACRLADSALAQAPSQLQYQRRLNRDDALRADSLQSRADAAEDAQDYPTAIELHEQLLELRTRALGADHWETISEKWAVDLLRRLNELPRAKQIEWRKSLEERHAAGQLRDQGEWDKAEALQSRHLQKCRDVLGEQHPYTARVCNMIANTLKDDRRYVEAQPLFHRALDLNLATLGEAHLETARCYTDLGSNLDGMGRFEEADPLLQKALDILRQIVGETHSHTLFTSRELAFCLYSQGKFARAVTIYQKLLQLNLEHLGEEHIDTAWAYHDLGQGLFIQGKPEEALPLLETARRLFVSLRGETSLETSWADSGRALCLNNLGRYPEAEQLWRDALEIRTNRLGNNHADTAPIRTHLAQNLLLQGRLTEARELVEHDQFDIRGSDAGRNSRAAIRTSILGSIIARTETLEKARPLLQNALALYLELKGESHPETATAYRKLALNLTAQHHFSESAALLQKAVVSYEIARQGVALRGIERADFGLDASPYRLLAVVSAELNSPVEAFLAAEKDLARGVNDQFLSRRANPESDEDRALLAGLNEQLTRHQGRLVELVARTTRSEREEEELQRLVDERRSIESKLGRLAAAQSERSIAPLAEIQGAIPADAAFLLWVDVTSPLDRVQQHWGCVLRDRGDPTWIRLQGSSSDPTHTAWTDDDMRLPGRLRAALASPTSSHTEVEALTNALHAQRIAPLERHLDGVSRLYVVTVNEMAGIPVETLTDRYTISYIPSGTFLARWNNAGPLPESRLLALGDPDFARPSLESDASGSLPPGGLLITVVLPESAAAKARLQPNDVLIAHGDIKLTSVDVLRKALQTQSGNAVLTVWREGVEKPLEITLPPGGLGVHLAPGTAPQAIVSRRKAKALRVATRGDTWDELPGTRIEVAQIVKLFGSAADVVYDSAASEQTLEDIRSRGDLAKYRYLHFATHGKANLHRSMESVLILSQDKLPENELPQGGRPVVNGELSANEVLDYWNLNAELVTLSACETGLGPQGGGDGLLGFAQAFLVVGSRAVCLSLWKVDDAATCLLMTRFYQNLLGRRSGLKAPLKKAEALAEAKRWLRSLSAEAASELLDAAAAGTTRTRGTIEKFKLAPATIDRAKQDRSVLHPFAHPRYWSAFVLVGDPN